MQEGVLDAGDFLVQGLQTLVVLVTEEESLGVVNSSGGERGLGRESAFVRGHLFDLVIWKAAHRSKSLESAALTNSRSLVN